MSLFRRSVFDNDDDLFFRHPFVDRFLQDDDLDLFHSFRRSLGQPAFVAITAAPGSSGKQQQPQQQEQQVAQQEQAVANPSGATNSFFKQLSPLLGSDLVESETDYKIHVDLPGVEASDVDISLVENKYLVIQAERKFVHEEAKDKVHSMERSFGKVQRRFRLPVNADVDQANTTFKNGVLTLTFPKKVLSAEGSVRKLSISTA